MADKKYFVFEDRQLTGLNPGDAMDSKVVKDSDGNFVCRSEMGLDSLARLLVSKEADGDFAVQFDSPPVSQTYIHQGIWYSSSQLGLDRSGFDKLGWFTQEYAKAKKD